MIIEISFMSLNLNFHKSLEKIVILLSFYPAGDCHCFKDV